MTGIEALRRPSIIPSNRNWHAFALGPCRTNFEPTEHILMAHVYVPEMDAFDEKLLDGQPAGSFG